MPKIHVEVAKREAAVNPDPLIVEIEGNEYTCQNELPEFAMLDLAAKATNGTEDVVEAGAAFMSFLESVFTPDSWNRFRRDANKNLWQMATMLPMIQDIVQYMVGHPTSPLSDSPNGESPTSIPSTDNSSSEGGVTPPAQEAIPV